MKDKPTPECPDNCRYDMNGICIHETDKDGICLIKIRFTLGKMRKKER